MSERIEVKVPDIGDFSGVPVIEVLVAAGDNVTAEQSLVTLESDKATMEVPSPAAGRVVEVRVSLDDQVSQGDVVAVLETDGGGTAEAAPTEPAPSEPAQPAESAPAPQQSSEPPAAPPEPEPTAPPPEDPREIPDTGPAHSGAPGDRLGHPGAAAQVDAGPRQSPPVVLDGRQVAPGSVPYASPAIRAVAREFGVDLGQVTGSGRKGRIVREDVANFVKSALSGARPSAAAAPAGGGLPFDLPPMPDIDFSKFGEVEHKDLTRIQKKAGKFLHRNWVSIPHVTHNDTADITDMEAFRKDNADDAKAQGFKLTPLVFLMKASVAALKKFPEFNASLSADGSALVLKQYFHIGIAVDTPDGLVVPVIRNCDRKGIMELAKELSEVSEKARDGKLSPQDMQGGCFSISSLGGIGGTGFTPIINAPEVAILGVSRSRMEQVWNGSDFQPRLMLPLSLSYDHRVIDGAAAARFVRYLAGRLEDLRRLTL